MITRSKAKIPISMLVSSNSHLDTSEPKSVAEALSHPSWKVAMESEFKALISNHTWELVPAESHMNIVGCKWVFRVKQNSDGSIQRFKARLVAKGFQQNPEIDYLETFSPVIKSSTIRVVLSLAITYGWDIQQVDVNNAFLNGELSETVFMTQPQGFIDDKKPLHMCKLVKALYGLKQAPRAWFEKLKNAFLQWGFLCLVVDPSLFIYRHNNQVIYVVVYVDDILLTGSDDKLVQDIVCKLNLEFALKTLGSLKFFLGFEVQRTDSAVHISQDKYARDLLLKTGMSDSKPCSTPMALGNKLTFEDSELFDNLSLYWSTIGALQYLTLSRPEIAFSVNKLSQFLKAPTQLHWQACKRLLRYIKGTSNFGVKFTKIQRFHLECFTDADWAGSIQDRRSTSGCCLFLGSNLLQWSSRKQKVVALSSTEAEYRALAQGATEIAWFHSLFTEMGLHLPEIPVIWCDNQSANSLASNPVFHARTKHIELDIHYIREQIAAKKLKVCYVPTDHQTADIFTKSLSTTRFEALRHKLTVVSSLSQETSDTKVISPDQEI